MSADRGREPLAIVGIGCRLPGGVASPEQLWELLLDATDATCVVPETRWTASRFHDPTGRKAGKMATRRGGYLEDIDQFDAQFFGISPREANLLDPQQRLLLHATWEALEDAGMPAERVEGTAVGVFVGGFTLDYQLLQNRGPTSRFRFKTHSATGMMMTMLANRLSFAFDLRGPSMAIDTACSSSLVAVHLAAQSIWNGECHLALAGGVNVIVGPNTAIAESKSGFLSPDGRCKAFDEAADGYARGEGGAVVVLKPLARALEDGDHVYAQVLGSAVTQDGHTDGITVPSEDAQSSAITAALRRAGVAAREVGYVEAHGTGTPVGDPVEVRALARALASERGDADPLLIGSVKTNIGHLEAAAGVAGLIKAALVLERGYVPANLHFDNPSSRIPFAELDIDVPRTGRPFPGSGRRVAGINSFGFGGTNAHVVLAEPPPPARQPPHAAPGALTVLPISARSEDALVAVADRLAEYLRDRPETAIADLGYTLGQRRSHLSHRRAFVVDGIDDAREQLESLAAAGRSTANRAPATGSKVAFVCTGMGPQWWGMCRGLLDGHPDFAESIARTDRELSRYADWSLLEELRRDESTSRIAETGIAQPANFAVQLALAAQLRHYGITPDGVIGHSAGEVAAHHLAGLLTFEQAVLVIYQRSRLQQRTTGMGRMLAVGLGVEELMDTIDAGMRDEFGHRVSIAAINSPFALTLAGDVDVLDAISGRLDAAGVFTRYLSGTVPYHTHYMDIIKDDLRDAVDGLSSADASMPLYSTVTGERLTRYADGAAYWWQNTRATVLFEPAIRRMLDDGYTHFVELGPHPVLASSMVEIAGSQSISVLPTQRRNDDESRVLLDCVATLHDQGRDVSWEVLTPRTGARLLALPSYPWQSKRHWNEPPEAREELHYRPVHPLLGQPVTAVHPTWEIELSETSIPFLADHRVQGSVVVPGAAFLEMAMAAGTALYGTDLAVDDLVLRRALIVDDTCDPIVRTTVNQESGTVEFAAFTATADGDFAWNLVATAELNTLPSAPGRQELPPRGRSMPGDDFYARTQSMGFEYGDAFRTVRHVVAGTDWAAAKLTVPAAIAASMDAFRFHPALLDGAFQALFGTMFVDESGAAGTYVPTRVRHCAVYGRPDTTMAVHVRVVSATAEEIESDITIVDGAGDALVAIRGFTVQSLSSSSAMSVERIDRGLYELQWVDAPRAEEGTEDVDATGRRSWLVLTDAAGFGAVLAGRLRASGQHVAEVAHGAVDGLTESSSGYELDPQRPEQFRALLKAHLEREGELAGIIDCWPLDIRDRAESNHRVGVFAVLHLVNALAEVETVTPRVHLVTANAQPTPGSTLGHVEQAAIWGLGRVIGHQEFAEHWGGLIDIDGDGDGREATAERVCRLVLDPHTEDQVALRPGATLVPRLRPCANLTKPFPTKLSNDATYVVTGGTGALGRVVARFLAERGARHITLLGRSVAPPTATVETIRTIERLGARVTYASVDVADHGRVRAWLDDHERTSGRPIRGIVHAAGSVDDRLLLNMTEDEFTAVMAPKVTGTRVLDDAFEGRDLDFFVMFGSAGSVVASPGQGNYAAANAFLDAFAHHRRERGLPALTIGWGPWSVGMVEELGLERIYAQRGIDLITPAAGARILDRLLNQRAPAVVAITADWDRARQVGLAGALPRMFSDLETAGAADAGAAAGASLRDLLAATPESDRLGVIADHVLHGVSAIFDCAPGDVDADETLDHLGLDSLMAMEFRVRINAMFAIDLPVLEILRGVSVNSLAARVLGELQLPDGGAPPDRPAESEAADHDDLDGLIAELSDAELRDLLAELEKP